MERFGGIAAKETAATAKTTTAIGDSENDLAVTFRESGRIVVGKKVLDPGIERNKGASINDVRKHFGFFDPLPPLSAN